MMADNTMAELGTSSVSTSVSSVSEVLYTSQLSTQHTDGNELKPGGTEMVAFDADPSYGQLLRMVDVLSCTVEDLSKKMMLMMEYKEAAASKSRPHRAKDLKETRNQTFTTGARHSWILTKGGNGSRQRRKALPHPPSEAPPSAPDNFHIPESTAHLCNTCLRNSTGYAGMPEFTYDSFIPSNNPIPQSPDIHAKELPVILFAEPNLSRIRISGDLVPTVEPHALPGRQLYSSQASDKLSCQPFVKAQNGLQHPLTHDLNLAIDEKNKAHDLIVDSTSSTTKLNPTYSSDLSHFLELLDSRLTLLEHDWPHFLQLHLAHDESLSRLEHETSQALNLHLYGQHLDSTMPEVHSSRAMSRPDLEQVWDRQLRIDPELRSLVNRLERLPAGQQQERHLFGHQICDFSTNGHDLNGSAELFQTREEILEGSGPSIETSLLCTTTGNVDTVTSTSHLSWPTTSGQETQSLAREVEELRQRVLQWDSVHVPEWNAMYNELHEKILRLKYSDLTD
ncbi:hypothetical protein BGZ72_000904 [Mortierella alpina]|nr:hypothetical protein BGZ72_000904 [Mortierella alpina]